MNVENGSKDLNEILVCRKENSVAINRSRKYRAMLGHPSTCVCMYVSLVI